MISCDQYGFLAGRSAELQLLSCIDSWTRALDSNLCTGIVYIDYARAFDSVCHAKLLYKLDNVYGIAGNVLRWLHSFLQCRAQRVRVGSAFSESEPVLSGIPQGSCIGPILFILYINKVAELFGPAILVRLYADGIKLFLSYRQFIKRMVLQNSLSMLLHWSDVWQLLIRVVKCAVLQLGNLVPEDYVIGSESLQSAKSVPDLGVLVDSKLSFVQHVSAIVRKAYYSMSVLFKCFLPDMCYTDSVGK